MLQQNNTKHRILATLSILALIKLSIRIKQLLLYLIVFGNESLSKYQSATTIGKKEVYIIFANYFQMEETFYLTNIFKYTIYALQIALFTVMKNETMKLFHYCAKITSSCRFICINKKCFIFFCFVFSFYRYNMFYENRKLFVQFKE